MNVNHQHVPHPAAHRRGDAVTDPGRGTTARSADKSLSFALTAAERVREKRNRLNSRRVGRFAFSWPWRYSRRNSMIARMIMMMRTTVPMPIYICFAPS